MVWHRMAVSARTETGLRGVCAVPLPVSDNYPSTTNGASTFYDEESGTVLREE